MSFFKVFNDNLELVYFPKSVDKEFTRQKITLRDLETFLRHLKIIIPYFCEHPLTILESIEELKENGLQSVLLALHQKTQNNLQVWNGTIGEAIAASYMGQTGDSEKIVR